MKFEQVAVACYNSVRLRAQRGSNHLVVILVRRHGPFHARWLDQFYEQTVALHQKGRCNFLDRQEAGEFLAFQHMFQLAEQYSARK